MQLKLHIFPLFLVKFRPEGIHSSFLPPLSHPLIYLIYLPNHRLTGRTLVAFFLFLVVTDPLHKQVPILHKQPLSWLPSWPQMYF